MGNLRVVLPSGMVISVDQVKPITEKIVSFNGRKRRMVEVANNMKKESNGVSISQSPNSPMMCMGSDVIVGNLSKEKVCEIIRQLGEKGSYDFSQFKYQKVENLDDLKLGADYPPYTSENNVMLGSGVLNTPIGMGNSIFGGSSIFGSCDGFDDAGSDDGYEEEGSDYEEGEEC